jgi:hypothetical protein
MHQDACVDRVGDSTGNLRAADIDADEAIGHQFAAAWSM